MQDEPQRELFFFDESRSGAHSKIGHEWFRLGRTVKLWQKNVSRTRVKEGKIYLYDWSIIDDPGARAENFVAVHLQNVVQFYTERGMGDYKLCYLRDKYQREVDFVVIRTTSRGFW